MLDLIKKVEIAYLGNVSEVVANSQTRGIEFSVITLALTIAAIVAGHFREAEICALLWVASSLISRVIIFVRARYRVIDFRRRQKQMEKADQLFEEKKITPEEHQAMLPKAVRNYRPAAPLHVGYV